MTREVVDCKLWRLEGQRGGKRVRPSKKERAGAAMEEAARARTPRGGQKVAIGGGELGGGWSGDGSHKAWRGCRALARAEVVFVGCLAILTLLVLVLTERGSLSAFSPTKTTEFVRKPVSAASRVHADDAEAAGLNIELTPPIRQDQDRLIGGLLSPAFDEQSCRSRYASSLYRRPSPFRPSTYLVERLRRYEARHRRCGPSGPLIKEAVEHLRSGCNAACSECQYVVWTPLNGLGNRMLSLASTFVDVLLTDRVLLVHAPQEFDGLFCEPFPGSSWAVPPM